MTLEEYVRKNLGDLAFSLMVTQADRDAALAQLAALRAEKAAEKPVEGAAKAE